MHNESGVHEFVQHASVAINNLYYGGAHFAAKKMEQIIAQYKKPLDIKFKETVVPGEYPLKAVAEEILEKIEIFDGKWIK